MGKNEICWAIFSGITMLPFTMRSTKKQCISSHLFDRGAEKLRDHESCRKVVVNEFKAKA